MDSKELTQELIEFLSEIGHYQNFLYWMDSRGYPREEVESVIEKIELE